MPSTVSFICYETYRYVLLPGLNEIYTCYIYSFLKCEPVFVLVMTVFKEREMDARYNPFSCCLLSDCCQKINVTDSCMEACVTGNFQSVYQCEADYSKILTCASGIG